MHPNPFLIFIAPMAWTISILLVNMRGSKDKDFYIILVIVMTIVMLIFGWLGLFL
jgi:hypothetical protein